MKKFSKKEKGFTLIEALIVVIIVAILAALGVARFVGTREAAAKSTCASHLSTLNAAIKKYDLEHPNEPFNGTQWEDVWVDAGRPECSTGLSKNLEGKESGGYYYELIKGPDEDNTNDDEYQAKCDAHGVLDDKFWD